MNYNEFVLELMNKIIEDEEMNVKEADMQFLADGISASDDNPDLLAEIRNINLKYHDMESDVLEGNFLVISNNDIPSQMSGRFETDRLYKVYQKSGWDPVMKEIRSSINLSKIIAETADIDRLMNYDAIKDSLIIRPINYSKSMNLLKSCVYRTVEDIALVLYFVLNNSTDSKLLTTSKIHKDILESWGRDKDEVWDAALRNTMSMAPPRLYNSILDLMHPTYNAGRFMNVEAPPIRKTGFSISVITTTKKTNGAIAMFYPGVQERIAELAGGSYYVAFTSIHEAHIHPYGTMSLRAIKDNMLSTIAAFDPSEMLTKNVFYYDAKRKKFYSKL